MIANRSCHIKRFFLFVCFFFKRGVSRYLTLSDRKKMHLTRQVCWTTEDRKLLLIKFYYQVRELLIWLLKKIQNNDVNNVNNEACERPE